MSLKERLRLQNDPVFLLDGSAFIYRAFFGNKNLRRSDGFPTNALVVVTRLLLRILREEQPRYLLFIQDGKGKNFRHDLYPLYKANREAMPEDLAVQIAPVHSMLRALGIRLEVSRNCEADDCIASLAARFRARHPVVIVSGDKDLRQCLADNVVLWDPAAKEEKLLTEAKFIEETGINPCQWPDMQAIVGDTSDNIPGVPGIGPTTAGKIFSVCRSLEDIQSRLAVLPQKIQDKLRDHMENTFVWRKLTTLSQTVCEHLTLDDMRVRPISATECRALSDEFELTALYREIGVILQKQSEQLSVLLTTAPGTGSVTTVAAQNKSKYPGRQVQLLDMSTAPEATTNDSAVLPDCANRDVAIVWPQGERARLAVAESGSLGDCRRTEYLWTGSVEALKFWLAAARRVITVDSKVIAALCPEALQSAPYFDLGIAAWLLNPEENDYSWPKLAARFSALRKPEDGECALAFRLSALFETRLKQDGLLDLYATLELPLVPVLADMEARGIAVDAAALQAFLAEVKQDIKALTEKIYTQAGAPFNLRSARQLGEALFDTLKLPRPRKTRGGQASTSQETLEKLLGKHTVVDDILRFRKLEKMRSTYLSPLPLLTDALGRLHTTFNQKATVTGRLSSSAPNLQNIPVRGEMGKRMRACFIATDGNCLISADYSQVELRVLAHVSGDKTLLEAFRRNEDIHTRTAALIYDLQPDQVRADQRRNAKTINFGLIYGMGAHKLAQELKTGVTEAKHFISRYFASLTGLKEFYDNVETQARKNGFVTTLAGRRRLLPDIYSANGQAFALARRQAINTVIQGSAADIIKLAMLAVARDERLLCMNARLILQVHDELVLEAPADTAKAAAARAVRLMADVRPGGIVLSVPLTVDIGVGSNWAEAH
ncbi:MAG: DNA polymerase I [Candidatus Desulfovibrio kirbyi]|uniref:DNA polymerase I n=1 Tax=Candidatus Desulfovibrio kirbyi TaxID=2696086 RepID=A0A6L2R510_9BACT|nr:MAG: DNA polymerase I [Candidatus Desulfovibrio kirbyi]